MLLLAVGIGFNLRIRLNLNIYLKDACEPPSKVFNFHLNLKAFNVMVRDSVQRTSISLVRTYNSIQMSSIGDLSKAGRLFDGFRDYLGAPCSSLITRKICDKGSTERMNFLLLYWTRALITFLVPRWFSGSIE